MANRSDDFNRANNASALGTPSDAGGGYTVGGDAAVAFQIFSNAAYPGTIGNVGAATLETSDTDGTLSAVRAGSSPYWGLVLRNSGSAGAGVYVNFSTTAIAPYTFDGATLTAIGSGASGLTIAVSDVLSVTVSGNNYEVFQNGVSRHTFSSSHQNTATMHGIGTIYQASGGAAWDDLTWTSASPPPPPGPPPRPPVIVRQAVARASTH